MSGRRFLLVTWEGGGTTPPELAIARRLIKRGHEIVVLGDACIEGDARAVGAGFRAFRHAPQRATRTPESEIIADWGARTPLGAFQRSRDRHAFAPAARFAEDVLDSLAEWPADCVIADAMLFGALVGAEASRLPFAAIIPMTSFLPAPGRPPPALGLRPVRGALGALRDRALLAFGDFFLWRSCLPLLNAARRSFGLSPVAHPLNQIRRADRVLVLTDAHFDFDARARAGNVVYTGPELDDPVWAAPMDPEILGPSGDARPRVLVALSSSYQAQEALLSRVITALGALPVRAIVTLGPSMKEAPCAIPENVVVRASLAHSEALPHMALTITHGGHGTVIRSLAAGVPLLVIPMGRDQADNAARVEWLGAGRRLPADSDVKRITAAVRSALASNGFAEGARAFAAHLSSRGRDIDAALELEGLCATTPPRRP